MEKGRQIQPSDSRFWIDRPTYVTGATGLVGSWLVKKLISLNAQVICLERDRVADSEFHRCQLANKVTIIHGDISDYQLHERILGEYQVDTVFHLAAQTIVQTANQNPTSTFDSNIKGTWNLLEAARRSPSIRQVIVASSDKAYGNHEILPYSESAPLIGRHPYDVSKSCADLISQSFAHTYKLPVIVTRCGNFFGGGDLNWSRLIPGTIRSTFRGQRPVIRSDGSSIRDYFYVEDGVAAYILLAEQLAKDRSLIGEAFNFSNEIQCTALDMVNKILNIMQADFEPDIRAESLNEIPHQYLSATKARKMLDWSAHFNLDQALQLTVQWYREFLS